MQIRMYVLSAAVGVVGLTACGGGGGGGGSAAPVPAGPTPTPISSVTSRPTPTPTPTPTPAPTQSSTSVSGTVVQIASDGFGPATYAGKTYSYDSAGTPLAGATVIIGPVPVTGATVPPSVPTGDVATTTNGAGAFTASVVPSPAPASTAQDYAQTPLSTFVLPTNNITSFTPPATGYYVEVYGPGTDGVSAGALLPVHAFRSASAPIALRETSASAAEAGALAALNADRAANGAGPLTWDEAAEEAARLHAYDESANGYFCHYDLQNVGPQSRYLQVGGVGLTGENLAGSYGGLTAAQAFAGAEAAFMAEKTATPPGGHYTNNVDTAHTWAGLAAIEGAGGGEVDYELADAPGAVDNVVGAVGYTNEYCPPGITVNNSIATPAPQTQR